MINKFFKLLLVLLFMTFGVLNAQPVPQNEDAASDTTEDATSESTEAGESDTTEEAASETPIPIQPTLTDGEGAVKISNILVNDFEDADRWYGAMSIDHGLIQVEKRKGAVKEIREAKPDKSKFVLGAKVHFFKRGFADASIEPPAPIVIPGYTKRLSVWTYGRGTKHKLSAIVRDFKGRIFKFSFGELSFNGWKQLEAEIPSNPAWPFFSQIDVTKQTFYQTHGVTFLGFFLEFDPNESFGRFYVYLDEFQAESNVYLYEKEIELAQIPEDERIDPLDDW